MSAVRVIAVACDGFDCSDRVTTLFATKSAARDALSDLGWWSSGERDLCPYHAEREGEA